MGNKERSQKFNQIQNKTEYSYAYPEPFDNNKNVLHNTDQDLNWC